MALRELVFDTRPGGGSKNMAANAFATVGAPRRVQHQEQMYISGVLTIRFHADAC